ncbi:MAG: neutral zinc metallopeptidase [Chloroflexia bacterium]|nr:neutral zinc metallopeptidase [Chloroflexia bacterium]
MPRRPLQALAFAVLVGVTPLTSFAAPASQVAPRSVPHQEEWVQDANGEWVPAETWTDPATDPAVGGAWSDPTATSTWEDPTATGTWVDPNATDTWVDPNASGEAWVDPNAPGETWTDPAATDTWTDPAADDTWTQPEFSGFTMPGLTPDNLTDSVLADIDAFWAEDFAARGVTYYTADIVPVTDTMTTNCGPFGPYDNPAAFCPLEDAIYYSVPLSSDVTAQVGDFAWITVLAHEWGHHVQLLMNIEPTMSMERELQADCFAGAYAQRALLNGFLQEGDVTEAVVMNIMGGDPVELGETAAGAHGSSDYRVTAFMQGYFNGANVCFENPSAGA